MSGRLASELQAGDRVFLDANVFIYYLQEHPRFAPCIEPVFDLIASGKIEAVASVLTLLEILVRPLREGRLDLADQYAAMLAGSDHLQLLPVNAEIARRGSEIRASSRSVRTPDAIQIATADVANARVFLTNDRGIRAVAGTRTLLLEDYVPLDS
jgi:predicted nucleic acid-binding protein